ncbi:MAG TPA: tetratricopeptide repeat protein [Capillimicrobium sp.]|nr:tetratricopeptide repeat protein [Capillimicrobium sp.]
MVARLAIVAVSVVLVVLLAGSLRHHDACESARTDVIAAATGAKPQSVQEQAIDDIREHCRGAQSLVSASAVLYRQERFEEAQALAQEAVDAEPDNATAWNALAVTAAETDVATARRAAARAVQLSPLDPPAVPLAGAGGP